MSLITLETENPVAIDSPDHIAPAGTIVDNRTNVDYVNAVKNYFETIQSIGYGMCRGTDDCRLY